MNMPSEALLDRARAIAAAVHAATARIVPAWPLDRLIAVNPYEGHADKPIADAQARLDRLCGTSMLMPRTWYRDEWLAGRLCREDLEGAVDLWLEEAGARRSDNGDLPRRERLLDALLGALEPGSEDEPLDGHRLPLATALADGPHLPGQPVSWAELVVHQVSQHCAAWFDDGQSAWRPDPAASLYASWRERIAFDRGLPSRDGRAGLRHWAAALPADPLTAVTATADLLCVADADLEEWCEALLLDVGGWAAACAYRRRQQAPTHVEGALPPADPMEDLLGIRAGWEWLLLHDDTTLPGRLRAAWHETASARARAAAADPPVDWLLQSALEHAYSRPLCKALAQDATDEKAADHAPAACPAVQALFCIDVRSEPFRRALEAADPTIRTYGFAGFFGVPLAHLPLGTDVASPRVPGLLAASVCATQTLGTVGADACAADDRLTELRQRRLQGQRRWSTMRSAAASAFGFVEAIGLSYAGKLLKDSLPSAARPPRWEDNGLRPGEAANLRLRLAAAPSASSSPDAARAGCDGSSTESPGTDLAARILGVLGAIGLKAPFAPIVLIAGHGSQTRNNPHAASLDCGACGGHTGEVNARLLAQLLNDNRVRSELALRGTAIPPGTWFVAGLHNTTTDEVTLFEDTALPETHTAALARLSTRLREAGDAAREARAPSVCPDLASAGVSRLLHALRVRGNDWAQTRPEWGLAGNAAFIAAPRARTARLDLQGRAFLHDYHCTDDPDLGVLELIMTAPLVVANWINLQYYASTVDPLRYGSGNKLLHNVVGGHIGVFEGNGGDLRIGLPWQSVHDGERFRHVPLRLHAFIEAPASAIEAILGRQPRVRALIEHGWMHLFRLPARGGLPQRYLAGRWLPAAACTG
ncbi:MAG: YbcC family protein [bacterium]